MLLCTAGFSVLNVASRYMLRSPVAVRETEEVKPEFCYCQSRMSDEVADSDPAVDEIEGARGAMLALFPAIFAKAVLEASANDRQELIRKFAHSPLLDWHTVQRVLGLAASSQSDAATDSQLLLASAKQLLRVVIAERTEKAKNEISVQYSFNGEVVSSMGHALNEGVTHLYTNRVMSEYIDKDSSILGGVDATGIEELLASAAYTIETKLAQALVAIVGEKTVGKAYFGGVADLEALMLAVDERVGAGTFLKLLHAADCADWRAAFGVLNS
jgi:hypothetical protein